MENWTKIFTSNKEHLITLAKQMLEGKGFETQTFNQKDSSYLFGYIYLYVRNDVAEECKLFIEQFKKDLSIE